MLRTEPTDEQIAAQEERNAARDAQIIRKGVAMLVSCGLLIAAIVLMALAVRENLIPEWLFNSVGAALFLGWLAYVFLRLKLGAPYPGLDIVDKEYLRKSIDFEQRRSRASLALLLWNLLVLAFVFTMTTLPRKHPVGFPPLIHTAFTLFAAAFVALALVSVLILTYGDRRIVIDELSRAQRAKAAQLGHILAVTELAALLVVSTYRPQWVLTSLPLAIATVVALPGAYFIYLEWRSNRE